MDDTMPSAAFKSEAVQRADAAGDPRLDWFRDARFGMFIHWGLYALPAGWWRGERVDGLGEWIMKHARIPDAEYSLLASAFNPTEFDAAEWVRLAVEAGQRYITITTKHHDGFCLFDSQLTDYTIVKATPFGRDPLAELARECAAQGVRLCFYYSQTQDWHHPGGHGNDWDHDEVSDAEFEAYLETFVIPQLRELLTGYGPVGVIWFDTPLRITEAQSRRLVDFVHDLQPDCLVSGRIGNGLGDYGSAIDQSIPDAPVAMDWEACMTVNDTWGFRRDDQNWKPARELIHQLIDSASRGGNYLLNVGPTAAGTIPPPSVERLRAIGAWLDRNGASIYGTRPGPFQGIAGCRSTAAGATVFVHVLDWPAGGVLALPDPGAEVTGARLLHDGTALTFRQGDDGLVVHGPDADPDADATVIALTCATGLGS